jgi:regulator of ribonuclease activity A
VEFTTADLCDAFPSVVQLAEPLFRSYGGLSRFSGAIEPISLFEDNTLVQQALETPGHGRVLVVDGGGSLRCALLGGRLATLAQVNEWAGVIIHGCVRDSVEISQVQVGILALNTSPRRSEKKGRGERGRPVTFAGVSFSPGHFVYVDPDGLLTSNRNLLGTAE